MLHTKLKRIEFCRGEGGGHGARFLQKTSPLAGLPHEGLTLSIFQHCVAGTYFVAEKKQCNHVTQLHNCITINRTTCTFRLLLYHFRLLLHNLCVLKIEDILKGRNR